MSKNPYMWKTIDREEKQDLWPKKIYGHSLVHDPLNQELILLGGDFPAYDNLVKNQDFNFKMIKSTEKDLESFKDISNKKILYLTDTVFGKNNVSKEEIMVYNYANNEWRRQKVTGNLPRASCFQEAIVIGQYFT